MVHSGRIDCALIFVRQPNYSKLEYHRIRQERLLAVCGKDNPLVRGKDSAPDTPVPLSLADLKGSLFCLMDQGFIVRAIAEDFFAAHQFTPAKTRSMSSMNALVSMVSAGDGIAFIPEYVLANSPNRGQLAFLELEQEPLEMVLALTCPKRSLLSPAARLFTDFIQDACTEE